MDPSTPGTRGPDLAQALASASAGDGTPIRALTDSAYERQPNGTYGQVNDRYFLIEAAEQRYPHTVGLYLRAGRESYREHPHVWWNNGYVELNYGLYPIRDHDAYYSPWRIPPGVKTPLVIGNTYDPIVPYQGTLRLVHYLGNARLLTLNGDGHGSLFISPCIDRRVNAYLFRGVLPPPGTVCQEHIPFQAASATTRAIPPWISPAHRP